jgi:chromatin remodeling complex protein RSC6
MSTTVSKMPLAAAPTKTDQSKRTRVGASDGLALELRSVYQELSDERKNITRIMANVKKCFEKIDRHKKHCDAKHPKTPVAAKETGLTKPFPVSTSLCAFMSVPEGTLLPRAEVTKYLHQYIRERNLYDKSNKQYIIPDTSLKALFNLGEKGASPGGGDDGDAKVHIFSMQKKMNTHFKYSA